MIYVAALVYALVAGIAIGPSLFPSGALSGGDWETAVYPFYAFCSDTFRAEGRLPFWNPYVFAGMPHLVSLNTFSLYPTELLSLVLGIHPATFYALDLMFHLSVAGLGLYAWLRYRGMVQSAAFTGGLCYVLGNNLLTQGAGGHPHWVRGMAWLPWMLLCVEKGNLTGRSRWFAAAGALLGVVAMGGAIHFVICAAIVLSVWVLVDAKIGPAAAERRLGRRAADLCLLGLCAVGVGAVILLPGFQYYLHSVRTNPTSVSQRIGSSTLWDMIETVAPGFLGDGAGYYGPRVFRVTGDYPGFLPICLAGLGIVTCWRSDLAVICLGAVSLILAFGPATPLGAALAAMPVFSGLRASSRWFSFVHLALSVLAAHGWGRLVGGGSARLFRRWLLATCAVAACVCVIGLALCRPIAESLASEPFVRDHLVQLGPEEDHVLRSVRQAFTRGMVCSATSAAVFALAGGPVPLAAFSSLAWLVIVADLELAGSPFFIRRAWSTITAPSPAAAMLSSSGFDTKYRVIDPEFVMKPDQHMFQRINSLPAYHTLALLRTSMLDTVALGPYEQGGSEMMAVLNVRCGWRSLQTGAGVSSLRTTESAFGRRYKLAQFAPPLGSAFLAERVLGCASLDEVFFMLRLPNWRSRIAPLDGGVPPALRGRVLPITGIVSVVDRRETPEVELSLREPGFLVFSRAWYPAWVAFVDGERSAVLRAYGGLCGVEVPAGRHVVRMSYESVLFKLGLLVSSAAAASLLCLFGLGKRGNDEGTRLGPV